MTGDEEQQLFLDAAARIGLSVEDPVVTGGLLELFAEYARLREAQEGTAPGPGVEAIPVDKAEVNDEDTDEETGEGRLTLTDWFAPETEEILQTEETGKAGEDGERAKGAGLYFNTLQEAITEAKRIENELKGVLTKGKESERQECRGLLDALNRVVQLDSKQSPRDIERLFGQLENAAYDRMVERKGLFGNVLGNAQRIQELAKQGWALAGQTQVDLDIGQMRPEDPRSRIDPELSLEQQMNHTEHVPAQPHTGRLQRLVRFDDLQSELKSQKHRWNERK
ncbi:MAG: hypothetical protein K6B69_03265 [Lachnospiraceae bacterium]|nr:hypothetical protein [Lachnospiraceae bacterium]